MIGTEGSNLQIFTFTQPDTVTPAVHNHNEDRKKLQIGGLKCQYFWLSTKRRCTKTHRAQARRERGSGVELHERTGEPENRADCNTSAALPLFSNGFANPIF